MQAFCFLVLQASLHTLVSFQGMHLPYFVPQSSIRPPKFELWKTHMLGRSIAFV
jgi:hypothetical protein